MHNLQPVIDLIVNATGYQVYLAREREFTLLDTVNLPVIMIGHFHIDNTSTNVPGSSGIFNEAGENLVEDIEIHIQALPENLYINWRAVAKAINGKNPFGQPEQTSVIGYRRGDIIGYENGIIKWVDYWSLSFPSLNPYI